MKNEGAFVLFGLVFDKINFHLSFLLLYCMIPASWIMDTLITMYQRCFPMDSPFLMGFTFKKVWKKSSARNDHRTYCSNQEKCKPEHKNTFLYSSAKLLVLYVLIQL